MRRIRTRGHNVSQLPTRQGDLQRGSRGFCGKGGMSIFLTCCLVVAIILLSKVEDAVVFRCADFVEDICEYLMVACSFNRSRQASAPKKVRPAGVLLSIPNYVS